jgi:hypothetical protein
MKQSSKYPFGAKPSKFFLIDPTNLMPSRHYFKSTQASRFYHVSTLPPLPDFEAQTNTIADGFEAKTTKPFTFGLETQTSKPSLRWF